MVFYEDIVINDFLTNWTKIHTKTLCFIITTILPMIYFSYILKRDSFKDY